MFTENTRRKLLVGLAVFLILLANFSLWISRNIYNAENFKNNINVIFQKQEVRDAIASETVDSVLKENPALNQILSSPMQSAISGILSSPFVGSIVDKTATRLQNYIVTGQNEVTIDLTPLNRLLTAISRVTSNQDLAPEIKRTEIVIFPANAFPNLNKWLSPITTIGPFFGFIGLGILIYFFVKTKEKLLELREFGWYILIGSVINLVILGLFSNNIPKYFTNPNASTIAVQSFNVFTASYIDQIIVVMALAVVLLICGYYWPKIMELFNKITRR